MFDLRDTGAVEVCPCSSRAWALDWVIFQDGEIVAYSDKMKCVMCGTLATPPMPGVNT